MLPNKENRDCTKCATTASETGLLLFSVRYALSSIQLQEKIHASR